MKKIFTTLLAGMALATGFAGVKTVPQIPEFKVDKEALAQLNREKFAEIEAGLFEDPDYTRSWKDAQGYQWNYSLKFSGLTILNVLPETAQEFWSTRLIYLPACSIIKYDQNGRPTDGAIFYQCWPSYYWYEQIFDASLIEGSGEDADIPEAKRDNRIVPPSILMNNPNTCRSFIDSEYVGLKFKSDGSGVEYYYMFCQDALLKGQSAESVINDSQASTISYNSFDIEDSFMDLRFNVMLTANNNTGTLTGNYTGDAEVEGFEPSYVTTNEFTEIHLVNGGVISSESLGANSDFTEDFDPVTQFFMFAVPDICTVSYDATAPFGPRQFGIEYKDDLYAKDVNLYVGHVFGDASYGNDITLDPKDVTFSLLEPEAVLDPVLDEYYPSIAPAPGSFVGNGYDYTWSDVYGFNAYNMNRLQYLQEPSTIEWGTTAGLNVNLLTVYDRYITSTGKANVIYHYDPKDYTKTRTFSSVGDREAVSAVKGVQIDGNMKVIARNGMINIVAGEKAPIAIYTLDGKLVKAAKAAELSVEAPKGMYVVRVGNQAKKVVL